LLEACQTALNVLNEFLREHEEYTESNIADDAKQIRQAIAHAEGHDA